MITCTRRVQFCAGHRIPNHEGKCQYMHGHNYVAFFTVSAQTDTPSLDPRASLDALGRVVDFSVLKEKMGGWIEEKWDHGFLHYELDEHPAVQALAQHGDKHYALPFIPTAEHLAYYLCHTIGPAVLPSPLVLQEVTLWETENCFALARAAQRPPAAL